MTDVFKPKVGLSSGVFKILRQILISEHKIDRKKYHFWAVGLDFNAVVRYIELVHLSEIPLSVKGIVSKSIFRIAVLKGVDGLILAQNRPDESMKPGPDVFSLNQRLCKAGKFLGINVFDHLVLSQKSFFSFVANDLM